MQSDPATHVHPFFFFHFPSGCFYGLIRQSHLFGLSYIRLGWVSVTCIQNVLTRLLEKSFLLLRAINQFFLPLEKKKKKDEKELNLYANGDGCWPLGSSAQQLVLFPENRNWPFHFIRMVHCRMAAGGKCFLLLLPLFFFFLFFGCWLLSEMSLVV